jgi:hypothetical protein
MHVHFSYSMCTFNGIGVYRLLLTNTSILGSSELNYHYRLLHTIKSILDRVG